MEESGKAIALHERRVSNPHTPEGDPFVDDGLQKLWASHTAKLQTVHDFLVNEQYWFGAEPSDPEANAAYLGTFESWTRHHNHLKQRGFYVDVDSAGEALDPPQVADPDAVREVIGHVHQIGWQLRLGEHIEGRRQESTERSIPPATDEELDGMRDALRGVDPAMAADILAGMKEGCPGEPVSNAAYGFQLPANSLETLGRPGYEAQTREVTALAAELDADQAAEDGPPAD